MITDNSPATIQVWLREVLSATTAEQSRKDAFLMKYNGVIAEGLVWRGNISAALVAEFGKDALPLKMLYL